ncbi:unnamed protein product [Musa textilis]
MADSSKFFSIWCLRIFFDQEPTRHHTQGTRRPRRTTFCDATYETMVAQIR